MQIPNGKSRPEKNRSEGDLQIPKLSRQNAVPRGITQTQHPRVTGSVKKSINKPTLAYLWYLVWYIHDRGLFFWLLYVWRQFTNPKLGANSPRPLVGKPTFFMVAWTSSMVELVHATIKYVLVRYHWKLALNFPPII